MIKIYPYYFLISLKTDFQELFSDELLEMLLLMIQLII
jgi:hypothetical protein